MILYINCLMHISRVTCPIHALLPLLRADVSSGSDSVHHIYVVYVSLSFRLFGSESDYASSSALWSAAEALSVDKRGEIKDTLSAESCLDLQQLLTAGL